MQKYNKGIVLQNLFIVIVLGFFFFFLHQCKWQIMFDQKIHHKSLCPDGGIILILVPEKRINASRGISRFCQVHMFFSANMDGDIIASSVGNAEFTGANCTNNWKFMCLWRSYAWPTHGIFLFIWLFAGWFRCHNVKKGNKKRRSSNTVRHKRCDPRVASKK